MSRRVQRGQSAAQRRKRRIHNRITKKSPLDFEPSNRGFDLVSLGDHRL